MAEEVNTGGVKRFVHQGGDLKLDDERKREIREAYARADERKARERKNRIILWVVGIIILIILILLGIWKFAT